MLLIDGALVDLLFNAQFHSYLVELSCDSLVYLEETDMTSNYPC